MAPTIWGFSDGKSGHVNQTLGLIYALQRRIDVSAFLMPVPSRRDILLSMLTGRFPVDNDAAEPVGYADDKESSHVPDLVIGAGHRTHLALLAARRLLGCPSVVLMKPSWPVGAFDLCLIPEHDVSERRGWLTERLDRSDRVVLTQGVLNTVGVCISSPPSSDVQRTAGRGLILIGGPSKHHEWDARRLLKQIVAIVGADPTCRWELTTSRRTPPDWEHTVITANLPNLSLHPFAKTSAGWVRQRLAHAEQVLVSEDSVSMLYEALSSDARVGMLRLPRRGSSRVIAGVDRLVKDAALIPSERWSQAENRRQPPLREADRCAKIIADRFFAGATIPSISVADRSRAA